MAESVVEVVIRARNELRDTLADIQKQLLGLADALSKGEGLDQTATGLERINKEMQNTASSARGTQQELQTVGQSAQALVFGLKSVVSGFLALKAVRMAREFADIAGRAETLGTVVKIVGANAGISAQTIEDMEKGIRAMGITASSARYSLTQMIQAGLVNAESADKAAKLARAAQDLAVVTGRNSSETFQRLVLNIQQMDSVGLRWMGLMVDRNKGERDYANLLGKSREQLTLIERRQAFYNSVMTESVKLQGSYEASMTNVAKQIQSLQRFEEEAARALGQYLLPAQLAVVKEWSKFLDVLAKSADDMDNVSEAAFQFGKAVAAVAKSLRTVAEAMIEWKEPLLLIGGLLLFKGVAAGLAAVTRMVLGLQAGMSSAAGMAAALRLGIGNLRQALTTPLIIWPQIKAFFIDATTGFTALRAQAALTAASIRNTFEVFAGASMWVRIRAAFAVGLSSIRAQVAAAGVWSGLMGGLRLAITGIRALLMGVAAGLVWVLPLIIAVQAFWEWWQARKAAQKEDAEGQSDYMKQAEDILNREEEIRSRILELEKEKIKLEAASARGSSTAKDEVRRVSEEIEKQNKVMKETNKEWEKLLDSAATAKQQKQAIDLRTEFTVNRANPVNELKKLQDELQNAKNELGLDKLDITPNLVVTNEFLAKIGNLKVLLDRLRTPVTIQLKEGPETVTATIREVTEGIRSIIKATERPEELLRLFATIDEAIVSTGQKYEGFRRQLQAKFEKSSLEKMAESTAFLNERLTEAADILKLFNSVQQATNEQARKTQEVFLTMGASVDQAAAGVYDLYLPLNNVKDLSIQLGRINLQSLRDEFKSFTSVSRTAVDQIMQVYEANKRQIDEEFTSREATVKTLITRLKDIGAEINEQDYLPDQLSDAEMAKLQSQLDQRYSQLDIALKKEEERFTQARENLDLGFVSGGGLALSPQFVEQMRTALGSTEDLDAALKGVQDTMSNAFLAKGGFPGTLDASLVRTTQGMENMEHVARKAGEQVGYVGEETQKLGELAVEEASKNLSAQGTYLNLLRERLTGIKNSQQAEREAWVNHQQQMRVLDEKRTKDMLAASKTQLEGLRGLYNRVYEAWKGTVDKMRSLDEQIHQTIVDRDRTQREIEREGMTEFEADADRRRELVELESEQRLAFLNKEYTRVNEIIARRKELVQEIASSGVGTAEELREFRARELNKISQDQLTSLRQQKVETVALAQEQKSLADSIDSRITQLTETINKLGTERLEQLQFEMDPESIRRAIGQFQELFVQEANGLLKNLQISLDENSLSRAVRQLQDAFNNIEVKVRMGTTSGTVEEAKLLY